MSWVCEYCSTVNEDDRSKRCFVCEQERSKASILAAKREARAAARERNMNRAYNAITVAGKVVFIGSIVAFLIVILIVLYDKMQDGRITDIINVAILIGKHALGTLSEGVQGIWYALSISGTEKLGEIYTALTAVVENASENLQIALLAIGLTLAVIIEKINKFFGNLSGIVENMTGAVLKIRDWIQEIN